MGMLFPYQEDYWIKRSIVAEIEEFIIKELWQNEEIRTKKRSNEILPDIKYILQACSRFVLRILTELVRKQTAEI